ncbi:NUDIX hydrolase [Kitasatospora sp. NBC_01246]|uniref:NUDIX hydrolase n=1 Tax=Kitasatospora sp. NBC_01246 TaxID=2903570 RepID=UPI002E37C7E8|nr:NUDIX hydrolase [Kitasatospora sp. NBC_01246]
MIIQFTNHGLPVPSITSWSAESPRTPEPIRCKRPDGPFLGYADELAQDRGWHGPLLVRRPLARSRAIAARHWEGEPYNREPDAHSEPAWVDPAGPPTGCHPFTHEIPHLFTADHRYADAGAPRRSGGGAG